MQNVFYFGCWSADKIGHFLYGPTGRTFHDATLPDNFPIRWQTLDGGLLPPKQPQTEGQAAYTRLNGWTIISFWDRSADKRGACNSAFVIEGEHTFEAACAIADDQFPTVWARFKFPITKR